VFYSPASRQRRPTIKNWWLYIVSVLIWGSTWLAIDFQLGKVSVEVSLVYRFFLASAVLFSWCAIRRLPLSFNAQAHRYFLLLGLFLFGLNYIAVYSAQIYISSALNAILFSTMIWMNIINSRLFLRTRIDATTYAGAVMGIIGVVILFWPEMQDVSWSDRTVIGAALSLTAAAFASFGNIISQSVQRLQVPVIQTNAWGMFYGGLLNAIFAVLLGKEFTFDNSIEYVGSLLFLAIPGSVIAFGCYLTLIGRIGVHRAGYVAVMIPVVAILVSVAFEGLEISTYIVVGATIALAGNLIVLRRRQAEA